LQTVKKRAGALERGELIEMIIILKILARYFFLPMGKATQHMPPRSKDLGGD
jgi:hypothetical protein